ncbi:hypothetical protein PQR71_23770 [Paraburkholderia fungorum]|uniref:DUF6538 domain-containing protein n=1 Tax=Paraburkholderia fungorum TaxID=134537 RepID=UPI0038BD0186
MTNYRSKRGNCYYFRRKIPLELQAHFGGRKEIVKALGTSDPSKADALCREHAVAYDTIFANSRHSLKAAESVRTSLDSAQRGAIVEQRDNWERAQAEHMEERTVFPTKRKSKSSRSMIALRNWSGKKSTGYWRRRKRAADLVKTR